VAPVIMMSSQYSVPYDQVQEQPLTRSVLLSAASLSSGADLFYITSVLKYLGRVWVGSEDPGPLYPPLAVPVQQKKKRS